MKLWSSGYAIVKFTLALFVVSMVAGGALAQGYPTRPVRIVIPFPSGSGADLVYRPIVEQLTTLLGQNVLIDPRPGGGTMIASLYVKTQLPDGYTLYGASNSLVVKSLVENAQMDVRKDFIPIVPVTAGPMIIAVNAEQIKARTLKELMDQARVSPGKLNYASYGIGSGANVLMEMLLHASNVKMVHVPFQGTPAAAAATAAGDTQVTGSLIVTLRPFLSPGGSGKLRTIASSMTERSSQVPDVPGMKESGFPDIDFALWSGIVAPGGTPRDIVDRVNQAVNAALREPKVSDAMSRAGSPPLGGTPEDLGRRINREYEDYVKLIREAHFKFE